VIQAHEIRKHLINGGADAAAGDHRDKHRDAHLAQHIDDIAIADARHRPNARLSCPLYDHHLAVASHKLVRLANTLHKGLAPLQRVPFLAVGDEGSRKPALPDHRTQVPVAHIAHLEQRCDHNGILVGVDR